MATREEQADRRVIEAIRQRGRVRAEELPMPQRRALRRLEAAGIIRYEAAQWYWYLVDAEED